MTNVRPKQIRVPPWPWTNRMLGGYPTVVEREPAPWMPELIGCYDWTEFEEQKTDMPGDQKCTRDMKSIFTTAVRMYGYIRLYEELERGNDIFGFIGREFWRWNRALINRMPVAVAVIGDDIAHAGGLFFPPRLLWGLYREYAALSKLFRAFGMTVIFHSDGNVTEAWPMLSGIADGFLLQKDLVDIEDERIINHDAPLEWGSYAVKEAGG